MKLPFDLSPGSRVLVAGAGGGYDVVCALPVALALREQSHGVHLANYSFTELGAVEGAEAVLPGMTAVSADCALRPRDAYCPEVRLARWWRQRFGEEQKIWCFHRVGPKPLTEAYRYLQGHLGLDAVIVLDGGVDGLFLGNEHDLGSPSMDATSILASAQLEGCRRIFAFTAFGTEGRNHEVRHADALLRIADLVRRQAMLGVCALVPGSGPGELFRDALAFIHRGAQPLHHSIVASSIASALSGCCGYDEVTLKARGAPVWVSPLTLLYWFFDLVAVAEAKPYYREALEGTTVAEVADAIDRVRESLGVLPRRDIPI